jgi:Homeodomain-like domain
VLTVEADAGRVEQRLGSGALACPGCSGVLAGWGHAPGREIRDRGGRLRLVPRRARCTGCGTTHVLLPVLALARRADTAAVIGAALTAKAAGAGHRRIAALLGRPAETVRGWLRRFAGRVEPVRVAFTGWCRALAADPVLPGPAGSVWADAIAAITAAASALASRFGAGEVPVWAVAAAISNGRLLAPAWPVQDDQHELTLPMS